MTCLRGVWSRKKVYLWTNERHWSCSTWRSANLFWLGFLTSCFSALRVWRSVSLLPFRWVKLRNAKQSRLVLEDRSRKKSQTPETEPPCQLRKAPPARGGSAGWGGLRRPTGRGLCRWPRTSRGRSRARLSAPSSLSPSPCAQLQRTIRGCRRRRGHDLSRS